MQSWRAAACRRKAGAGNSPARRRVADLDPLEEVLGFVQGFAPRSFAVRADRLGDLMADVEDRVKGGHRILEHHRRRFAAHRRQRSAAGAQNIHTIKRHRSAVTLAVAPSSRNSARKVTDLPDPDSPTIPRLSPSST